MSNTKQEVPFTRDLLRQRHRLSHQQIDELLKEKYSKEHLAEKRDQMFQVSEFIKLSDEFRKANLRFTPLKGPILSHKLHNDSSYRYSNDLDFLIPTNSIKKAIFILEENGYHSCFFKWPVNSSKERMLIKFNNQIEFIHPEKHIIIEIHWKLFKLAITKSEVLSKALKSNEYDTRFNEKYYRGFNNELELLYLIIHGGLHAWFRLKWLIDVKDYVEKTPIDTEKFTQLVDQCNASRMVSLCNATLSHFFPACPTLPCKSVRGTKKRLKFTLSQIEKNDNNNKSFLDGIKLNWFKAYCFPGFKYKLSVLGVIIYTHYLKTFEFYRTS